jgi:hypothetical protein
MKRILLLSILMIALFNIELAGQCITAGEGQYPSGTIALNTNCIAKVITTLAWTDEYSLVSGADAQTYIFSSSVGTDYITIADDATNTAIAWGTSPLTYTFGAAPGNIRIYRHDNSSCPSTSSTSRTISVQCTTCSAGTYPVCTNPTAPANNATNVSLTPTLTWPTMTNASQYKVYISNALADCNGSPTYTLLTTTSSLSYTIPGGSPLSTSSSYKWYVAPVACDGIETMGCDASNAYCFSTIPPPPSNDDCSGATSLTVNADLACGTTTAGTTVGALQSTETAPSCNATGVDDDVWYSFVATGAQQTVVISAASLSSAMAIYSGSCGSLTQLSGACATTSSGTATLNLGGLTNGTTYYVRVFTTSTGVYGTFTLCVGTPPPPPANDNCSGAIALTVNADLACAVTTSANTAFATSSSETAPSCSATGVDDDIWYSFTATATKHALVLSSASVQMTMAVYSGNCGALTQISGACANTTSGTATLNFTGLTIGANYKVRIFTTATSGNGTVTLCVGTPVGTTCSDAAPITSLPFSSGTQTTCGSGNDYIAGSFCNTNYGDGEDYVYALTINNAPISVNFALGGSATYKIASVHSACPPTSGNCLIGFTTSSGTTASGCYQFATNGTYYIYIDTWPSPTCGQFTLDLTTNSKPSNDDCSNASTLTVNADQGCGTVTSGNTSGATQSIETAPSCNATGVDDDVWYKFTATATSHEVKITGASNITGFAVYSGSCGSLTQLTGACGTTSSGTGTINASGLTIGNVYSVRVFSTATTCATTTSFNICIGTYPACPAPASLSAGTITGTSAILSWTENGSATTWDISYGVAPLADPNTGTIISGTSTKPYTLSGLNGETTYDFYVRAICGGTPSAWSSKATFTTLFDCATSTVLTCGSSVTSGNLAVAGGIWSFPGTFPSNSCGYSTPGKEKVYRFTPTATGTHAINITGVNSGSGYIDYFYKAAGSCSNTGWTCIKDLSSVSSTSFGPLTAGVEYYILLDAESASTTANHTFSITCPANMAYVSSTVGNQTTTSVGAGSVDASIVRLDVVVSGQANPLNVTSFTCNTNGSTSPVTNNVSTGKVYYTGTSTTFSTTTLVGSVAIAADGSFTITGNQALTGGLTNTTNYFWLAYDIKCGAVNANVVDGEFNSVTVGGTPYTPTAQAFTGARSITSLASYDTKADGNWSDPNTWACGVPPSGTTSAININHNVTFNQDHVQNASFTLAAGKTLTLGTNSLTINPTTASVTTTINGTLNVSGSGSFTVGSSLPSTYTANVTVASGGSLNISGGTCNIGTASSTNSSNLSVSSGGTFAVSSGTANIGPSGGFLRTLSISGTLNVSSTGTLNHNGSVSFATGSTFTQSGGNINIDPNSGSATTSVGSSTTTLLFNNTSHNVTGGTLTIIDPNFNTSTSAKAVDYSVSSTANSWSVNHLLQIGDGSSSTGGNTNGFLLESYTSTGRLFYGNLRIRGGSGPGRFAALGAWSMNVKGTCTVDPGSELRLNSSSASPVFAGDIVNDGTITSTVAVVFATLSGNSVTANNTPQNIGGTGVYKNLVSSPTANWTSITINNSQPVTMGATALTGIGSGSVSGTLTLTLGVLDVGSQTLTLGTSTTLVGTLTAPSNTTTPVSWIAGTFQRWIATGANANRYFPVGTTTTSRLININYTANVTTAGRLAATFNSSTPGKAGLPITYNSISCSEVSPTGYWQMTPTTLAGGTYTATIDATGFKKADGSTAITDLAGIRLAKRPDAGNWADAATAAAPSNLNSVSASGMQGFSVFGIIGTQAALPVELTTFKGEARQKVNMLTWETASEINSDEYIVERAPEAKDHLFNAIGTVEAKGNTTKTSKYDFMDEQPLPLSYYRLKIMDTDGSYEYSKIIVLQNSNVGTGHVNVYPVPAHNAVTFAFTCAYNDDVVVSITDLSGRLVKQLTINASKGQNQKEVNIEDLPMGMYHAQIVGADISSNVRIIRN